MSPILVRPVREQLEHDRVIRLLQAKYKRKFEVGINPGHEQNAPVAIGPSPWYPDLVLQSTDRARKLVGIVEVETTESVNHLEAMSQWVTFSKQKAHFHLYIPTTCIDSTRRLVTDLGVNVAELWAYQSVGDQIRFTIVQRSAAAEKARLAEAAERPKPAAAKPVAAKPVAAKPVAVAAKPVAPKAAPARPAAPARAVRPASAPKAARTTRSAAAKPVRRAAPAAAARRKPVAKPAAKPAARRATAKAPVRKTASSSRSQKRK